MNAAGQNGGDDGMFHMDPVVTEAPKRDQVQVVLPQSLVTAKTANCPVDRSLFQSIHVEGNYEVNYWIGRQILS